MGLSDVGELALMMSGNMDMMSGATQKQAVDYVELAKQAQATMSLQEKFNAVLAELSPTFIELLDKAHEWIDEILKPGNPLLEEWRERFVKIADALVLLVDNWKLVAAALIGAPALGAAVSFMLNVISVGMMAIGPAAGPATAGITALGGGFAAAGLAAMEGAIGIAIMMGFMVLLLALGPFIIEWVTIVVDGVISIVGVLADLIKVMTGDEMIAAALMVGTMAFAVYALIGSLPGLMMFSAGLVAVAGALQLIKTDDLTALGNFAMGIGMMDMGGVGKLGDALSDVAEAMDDIPTVKAITLTSTMNAAATAAEAVRILQGGTTDRKGKSKSGRSSDRSGGGEIGTINIKFNNDMFEDKIVRLIEDDVGRIALEAVERRG